MTFVIESQRVATINLAARRYARGHLDDGFKTLLTNSTEAKLDINLDILRNTVEVIEEGILANILWKKEFC